MGDSIAIDAQAEAGLDRGERLADFLAAHWPLGQLDLAVERGEVHQIFGQMRALARAGEQ